MNVVSAVASTLDQFRNRNFLASVMRIEKVYLHSIRFVVTRNQKEEKFRLWILVRARGVVEAEQSAETYLQELVGTCEGLANGEVTIKTLKPREVTVTTLSEESAEVLRLLQTMRHDKVRLVSTFERVDRIGV
ncbi:MAG: hypothetical protein MUC43_10885 [Pirellula sp.]|nr:hypothetical protein [Pirellula sp.]